MKYNFYIKKDDLTKIKSYLNPNESIRLVMEALCKIKFNNKIFIYK